MQVSAISNYYHQPIIKPQKTPSFNGGLNDRQYNIIIERLKKVNSEVKPNFSTKLLNDTINTIVERYSCLGAKSVALQIVSTKDLPDFLGSEASKYDLKDKIGICVAVGNKNAPIEEMTNIYDAVTILARPEDLSQAK